MLKATLAASAVVVLAASLCGEGTQAEGLAYDAGSAKQVFMDDALIARMHRLRLVVNRPTLTGEKCIVSDKPWEAGEVHCFGVSVVEDGDLIRMYYPSYDARGRLWFCYAESTDGIHWRKPDLDIVPFDGVERTNIIGPTERFPEDLRKLCFVTGVFLDTNPAAKPEERIKAINGDVPTWVLASPDGLHFAPMFDKPSYPAADTNNVCFFDDRIGRYVAYMRGWKSAPLPPRIVVRCEFDDLADFGPATTVFEWDQKDQDSLDKTRFVEMDFYNSSAIKYRHAANAYIMFPSAFRHYPENTFDGEVDIQLATSSDGLKWTRLDRDPFIPLQQGQNGLYMAFGNVRRGAGSTCTMGSTIRHTPRATTLATTSRAPSCGWTGLSPWTPGTSTAV
jgi:hypothetical protein